MNYKSIMADIQKERWAMSEPYLNAFIKKIENIDLSKVNRKAYEAEHDGLMPRQNILSVSGDQAIIKISGMLLKSKPFYFDMFDMAATEFGSIKTAISRAIDDDSINEVVLLIESGGGQVGGTKELADFIYTQDQLGDKPIRAFIQDMGASGAYWIASACRDITCNHNGESGSIGVFTVIEDTSKMFEDAGVKVHVIKNGDHKGDFTDGTVVTDEQIEAEKEIIDGLALTFHESVARGRNMALEDVQELGTGLTWLASQAQSLGLIDDVNSWDNFINGIESDTLTSHGGNKMANKKEEIVEDVEIIDVEAVKAEGKLAGETETLNRLKDLKAAFPENEKFALEQFEKGSNVEQAKLAFNDVLLEEVKELKAKNEELTAVAEVVTTTTSGAEAVASEVVEQVNKSDMELAHEYRAANNCTLLEAHSAISRQKRG